MFEMKGIATYLSSPLLPRVFRWDLHWRPLKATRKLNGKTVLRTLSEEGERSQGGISNQLIGISDQLIGISNQLIGMSNQLIGISNQLFGI